MQTGVWMTYSGSSPFSDKISYKILYFSSYQLKDMILARFEHLQQIFLKTETMLGLFSPTKT
jgi:hypothetical protein